MTLVTEREGAEAHSSRGQGVGRWRGERLRLGPDVVQRLLPHRPPLLMVDRVESFEDGAEPVLQASRVVSSNEEALRGHFAAYKIWPGIYTVEGLGQSCHLLVTLVALRKKWVEAGGTADDAFASLRNLEAGYRLKSTYRAELGAALLEILAGSPLWVGFSTAVDIRFLNPVFPGERIDYTVKQTRGVDAVQRFEVEAVVDGVPVARGRMGAANFTGKLPQARCI